MRLLDTLLFQIGKFSTATGTYAYDLGCYYTSPDYSSYVYCGWDQKTGNPGGTYGGDPSGKPLDADVLAAAFGTHLDIAMDSYCLDASETPANDAPAGR